MNDDLISREVLKKAFHERIYHFNKSSWDEATAIIDNALTVDTYTEDDVQYAIKEGHQVGYEMAKAKFERPHGKWLEDSGNIACSQCHTIWLYRRTDYCPNCGADMRGKENE